MAINRTQPHQPAFGKLLPFPSIFKPKFAGSLPAYQKTSQVQVGTGHLDVFETAAPRTARIIVRPENSLGREIRKGFEQLGQDLNQSILKAQAAIVEDGLPDNPFETQVANLSKMLSNAIQSKTVDTNKNAFALYKATRVAPKLNAKERAAALKQAGIQNTGTLLKTIEEKLESLPGNVNHVTIDLPKKLPDGVDKAQLVREISELITLKGYNYNFHRQNSRPSSKLGNVLVNTSGLSAQNADTAVKEGQAIGEATNLARHFVDSPANFKTTRYMAGVARNLASPTLNVDVLEGADLEGQTAKNNKRMGLFLSVGQGNDRTNPDRDPRLVEMVYTPKDWNPATGKTILLVGKGIVFDTGGNNLKPSEYIHNMEGDMAGAAAVMGTLKALDQMQLPGVRVVGLAPLTENRIGAAATLPNDIHVARNGKTVQISNTDAEGRLVLADAMHYGMEKYQPSAVADIATLTGGKVRAFGSQNSVALSGNNPTLMKQVEALEKSMRRSAASLQLTQNHHNWVTRAGKGKADVFNSVGMADAKVFGVIAPNSIDPSEPMRQHSAQGAAFLREFLPKGQENTPWVHYDMAGAEFDEPDPKRGNDTWATGFGVKELYFLVKNLSTGQIKASPTKTDVLKRR